MITKTFSDIVKKSTILFISTVASVIIDITKYTTRMTMNKFLVGRFVFQNDSNVEVSEYSVTKSKNPKSIIKLLMKRRYKLFLFYS